MDIVPDARARLAGEMEARRLDLGVSWREVAERAGLSYEMVMKLRARVSSVRPLTLRKLDSGLGWEPGSSERVLNGGEPVPAAASSQDQQITPLDAFERAVAESDLPEDEKAAAILRHREQIARQLDELGIGPTPSFVRRAVRRMGGGDGEPGESRQDARPA